MKPYIVRPVERGRARIHDRTTGGRIGDILLVFQGWQALCPVEPWLDITITRAGAAEALWSHYMSAHGGQR